MTRAFPTLALPAAGLLLMIAAAVVAASPVRAQAPAKSAVQVLFETTCSNCHDLAVVTGQRKSRQDWEMTMDSMMAKGAPITDEQANQILEYLVKTYADKN